MGLASSCKIFETFTTALQWIFMNKFGVRSVVHMVDDFLIFGPDMDTAARYLSLFQSMCQSIDVPLAPDKMFGPLTNLPFLGIELSTSDFATYLPLTKCIAYAKELISIIEAKSVTNQILRQVVGRLNWATEVIQGACRFIRHFIDKSMLVSKPYHKVAVSQSLHDDAKVWLHFLTQHTGKVMFLPEGWLTSHQINLKSDASPMTGAFIYGTKWLQVVFPLSWAKLNIAFLEMFPIVLGLDVFSSLLANHCITFIMDNAAVMQTINKQTSRHPDILQLVRLLVGICLRSNIHFTACHISTKLNVEADYLSHCLQPCENKLKAYGLSLHPVEIPTCWLPENYKLSIKD